MLRFLIVFFGFTITVAASKIELDKRNLHGRKLSLLKGSPSGHFIGRCKYKNQIGDYFVAVFSEKGHVQALVSSERLIHGLGVSSNGQYFAYALHDGTVEIRETVTGNAYRTLQKGSWGAPMPTVSLLWSQNDEYIISVSSFGPIVMWKTGLAEEAPKTPFKEIELETVIETAALSPDSNLLVIGNEEGQIILFNAETLETVHTLPSVGPIVIAFAFSKDGKTLVSSHYNGSLHVWDMETKQFQKTLIPSGPKIKSLQFLQTESLAIATKDYVSLVDIRTTEQIEYKEYPGKIFSIDARPEDKKLLVFCSDGIYGENVERFFL